MANPPSRLPPQRLPPPAAKLAARQAPASAPSQAVSGQVIVPDKLAAAKQAAEAERERIRREAHEDGKHHGLRLAGRYRDVALFSMGALVGAALFGLYVASIYDRGAVTAAAVVDQVLGRTVERPMLPAALDVRDAAEDYEANTEAAREGCTDAELRAGRRGCR